MTDKAIDNLGAHLLGRKYVEDSRDWTVEHLHDFAFARPFTSAETIGQLAADPGFTFWSVFPLWAYIKQLRVQPPPVPPPGDIVYQDPEGVLDQGAYGTCVGNGWAQWGNALPIDDRFTETDARRIYYEATCIGGACDSTYQNGAAVRDGAKAMQNRSRLSAYAFARNTSEIDTWLASGKGVVVAGSDWTRSMFQPDPNNRIHPTGSVEGGHCYILLGEQGSDYLILNSWGSGWGQNGRALISKTDFAKLLAGIDYPGEACVAIELT